MFMEDVHCLTLNTNRWTEEFGFQPNTTKGISMWIPCAVACSGKYAQDDAAHQTFVFGFSEGKKTQISHFANCLVFRALAAVGSMQD